ncbi:hypothetical protein ACLOJK_007279, partial [Asimina triloba]
RLLVRRRGEDKLEGIALGKQTTIDSLDRICGRPRGWAVASSGSHGVVRAERAMVEAETLTVDT